VVLKRVRPHVMLTGNVSEYQSAYRVGHSTETALLRVVDDVVTGAGEQSPTALLSLDISATFDTVGHDILPRRLSRDFGIAGSALNWLEPFVSDRTEYVGVGCARSEPVPCSTAVPQGSVLGPLLLALYISPLSNSQ